MNELAFNWKELVPDFPALLQGNLETPEMFSTRVVAFLLVVLLGFLVKVLWECLRTHNAVGFYNGILDDALGSEKLTEIKGSTQYSVLVEKRREIKNKAMENDKVENNYYGKLWREFDESLVVAPDGSRLSNTLDASHFFNTHTLAPGLTENRLMAAVPGFLTAIGVIGTFAGLQMGLANLDIKGSQDVEQIKQGIGAVTAGAAIAFMTSVWGVSTSVVFNIIEKILERIVRNKIATLQRRLDYLYPRIIAEQSLVRIADFGERSNESLQGLAEKIGDRLQEAMRVSTSNIGKELQRTLNEIMKPAINSLVNGAQESSERALRSLLSQFSEGLGQTGREQRQSMENASERINQMVHGLTDKLSEFLESAETQKSEMAKTFEQLMGHFGGRLDDLNEAASTRDRERHEKFQIEFESFTTANREAISTLLDGVSSQISEMGALERKRAEGIGKTMGDLVDTQKHLVNSVGGLIENQGLVHTEFMRQLREIQESYVNSARAQEVSSRAVTDASTQMQQAAQQLAQLSGTLRDSAQALGKSIGKAAEDTREAAGLSKNISLTLARLEQGHMEITNRMQAVTEKLLEASQHAQSGFEAVDRNLEKFRTGLSGQVQKMESQVADLMRGFALQVKETSEERMAEWNQQTSEYTNQMTQAIHALSGVVDEIEAKTRRD